jgi:hypothetical protein
VYVAGITASVPLLGFNIEGTNLPIHFLVNEPLAIRIAGTRLANHSRPARAIQFKSQPFLLATIYSFRVVERHRAFGSISSL